MAYFEDLNPIGKSTGGYFPTERGTFEENELVQLRIDSDGSLETRGAVLTDEGSFHDCFPGTSLSASWSQSLGTGGSLSVANSIATLASGTTADANSFFYKTIDFSPLSVSSYFSISQRIANEDVYVSFGSVDSFSGSDLGTEFVGFHFYGTDNTKVSCETRASAGSGATEGVNTQITLPYGLTTASTLLYKIIFNKTSAKFYVGTNDGDLFLVAERNKQLPDPYSILTFGFRVLNGATPPLSSTSVLVDTMFVDNYDLLSMDQPRTQTIEQHVVSSIVNTSVANLASGATFTGAAESTLNAYAIQVSFKSDKNCTIYVEQSADGTNWDQSDPFYFIASYDNFSTTVQATASFYRIRVTNTSTDTTTFLRLYTFLAPIGEALPRSLSPRGNLKTGVYHAEDEYGFELEYTPNGENRVVTPYRLVGASFEGSSLDATFWSTTGTTGTGTVTQASGLATVTTGAGVGTAVLQSVRSARYVMGTANVLRVSAKMNTTGFTNNTSTCGVYDGTDGLFFEVKDGVFSVVTSKNGSPTRVPNGSFNGILGSTIVLDTNYHTWEAYYDVNRVVFTIDGDVIHTVTATTAPWSNKYTLPARIYTSNSAGVTEASFSVRGLTIVRLGSATNTPISNTTSGQTAGKSLKIGPGVLYSVIITGSTNNSVITLYDNTSATGTVLWSATMTAGVFQTLDFKGISFSTGLYLVIATQNATITVIYE